VLDACLATARSRRRHCPDHEIGRGNGMPRAEVTATGARRRPTRCLSIIDHADHGVRHAQRAHEDGPAERVAILPNDARPSVIHDCDWALAVAVIEGEGVQRRQGCQTENVPGSPMRGPLVLNLTNIPPVKHWPQSVSTNPPSQGRRVRRGW
jgi:hypothetical protein